MSLRKPPQAKAPARPKGFQWDPPSDALSKWAERPVAVTGDDDTVINILDLIGEDWWTGGGFTAQDMAAALKRANGRAVTVNINSPGGDMFEGIAIYNQLAQYSGEVTVNVLALAASAASIIAMAGDTVRMALGSFLMIHNCWGLVIGNQKDLRGAAELFATFDGALAEIYEARAKIDIAAIAAMMDAETFLSPSKAIEAGFADETMADEPKAQARADAKPDSALIARRQIEAALAKNGISRSDRRQLVEALGTPRDASPRTGALRDASVITGLKSLISTMSGH